MAKKGGATKAEKYHMSKVAAMGCVACYIQFGKWETPGEIHHIREGQGYGQRSSHMDAICLCVGHHRHDDKKAGKIAIHGNTGRAAFEAEYGSERNLLEITLQTL